MKEFTFPAELSVPGPRSKVFKFFADPRNLEAITPLWLNFQILTPGPFKMQAGALVDYRIRVHGIPIRWRTEIGEWNPPQRFVDVQLHGPYTLWQHTHTFEERDGDTYCVDDVRYRPRGGILINWLFVRHDLERIFAFRTAMLGQILGKKVLRTPAYLNPA